MLGTADQSHLRGRLHIAAKHTNDTQVTGANGRAVSETAAANTVLWQRRRAYPAVYHAPAGNEAEERLGLLDNRFPDTTNQAVQSPQSDFHTTGHVERVKAGAVLRQTTHASFRYLK